MHDTKHLSHEDVRRILDRCPRDRHSSLFSATIPPEIETLIQWAMRNPETVEIGARRTPAETVKHVIYPVSEAQKSDLLLELLNRVNYDSVIVFCRPAFKPHPARTGTGPAWLS